MNKVFILLVFTLILLLSCTNKKQPSSAAGEIPVSIQYAKGFGIKYTEDYKVVTVYNPWDTTRILQQYVLIRKERPRPERLPPGQVITAPVNNIACFSSIDAAMLDILGELDKVKALAETRYVKIPALRNGLDNGTIADIGESTALNIEALMNIAPDIIIVSPFHNQGYGKLESTGIAIVENAGYMEQSPLGRAEWIRFLAAFVDKDKEAEQWMQQIADRYHALQIIAEKAGHRPTVLSELKYGSVWYVPGGNSYMAQLYHDAGSNYIWKDDPHTGSLSFSFETVYHQAENAGFWVVKGDRPMTYESLKNDFEPYSWFGAWKEKKIIYCNTAENNYYEEGVINPDLILKDLIHCFHPELLPEDYYNRYFKPLNE